MEINGRQIAAHALIPEVARLTDANASIIFSSILFWCDVNRINGKNYHDGRYWMYMTYKDIATEYIYLSRKQVETSVNKLRKAGLIIVGRYNKRKNDRTNWYAISDAGYELIGCSAPSPVTEITKSSNGEMDIPEKGNESPKKRKSTITYNKRKSKEKDINAHNKRNQFLDLAQDNDTK